MNLIEKKIMKKNNGKTYTALKKYFENALKEQLDADSEELKHWNEIGTDVFEYCKQMRLPTV